MVSVHSSKTLTKTLSFVIIETGKEATWITHWTLWPLPSLNSHKPLYSGFMDHMVHGGFISIDKCSLDIDNLLGIILGSSNTLGDRHIVLICNSCVNLN